jgi:hypothetical protein
MNASIQPVKPGLRERRYADAVRLVTRLSDQRDDILDKLTRINRKLNLARRAVARYEKVAAREGRPEPGQHTDDAQSSCAGLHPSPMPTAAKPTATATVERPAPPPLAKPAPVPGPLDPDMPEFLQRKPRAPGEADRLDAEAAAVIQTEQATRKRSKATGRIAKLLADKNGDRRRMPLSGKAAAAAIRKG